MAAFIEPWGQIQQGRQANAAAKSEANMLDFNAKVAAIQQDQTNAIGVNEVNQQRARARAIIGEQLAAGAQSGVGVNPDLVRESIFNMEHDTSAIEYNTAAKAQGYSDSALMAQSNASITRARGKAAQQAGYLNAATTLINEGKDAVKMAGGAA